LVCTLLALVAAAAYFTRFALLEEFDKFVTKKAGPRAQHAQLSRLSLQSFRP
jgi:hypothetical protein